MESRGQLVFILHQLFTGRVGVTFHIRQSNSSFFNWFISIPVNPNLKFYPSLSDVANPLYFPSGEILAEAKTYSQQPIFHADSGKQ